MTFRSSTRLPAFLLLALAVLCCACSEPWNSGYDPATAAPTPAAGGTFTIPSGRDGVPPIEVEVVEKGSGSAPAVGQTVAVHYVGTFLDGKEFENSRDHGTPIAFELGADGIIRGWNLVVERMHVGDRWKVMIPSPLAYGSRGSFGVIAADTDLVFDMELMEVR